MKLNEAKRYMILRETSSFNSVAFKHQNISRKSEGLLCGLFSQLYAGNKKK